MRPPKFLQAKSINKNIAAAFEPLHIDHLVRISQSLHHEWSLSDSGADVLALIASENTVGTLEG